MTIIELRQKIRDIDASSFFIKDKRYLHLVPDEILQHNCLHLVKANAKIADYLEKEEHQLNTIVEKQRIIDEVIPDLIIYALQFCNSYDLDPEYLINNRLDYILTKYPDHDEHGHSRNTLDQCDERPV